MSLAVVERHGIGGNNPPSPIETTQDVMRELSDFMAETPVVQTVEQAKAATLWVERMRKTLQDLDDARKAEVGPLNQRVNDINETYRAVRNPAENILAEQRRRLTDYTLAEEAKRIAELRRLEDERAEAERIAREAEAREKEAKAGATMGEITDLAAVVVEADQSFSRFEKADRAVQRAEAATHVRLPSKLGGKALSLRTKETLKLDDWVAAINAMGVTEKIQEAVLSAARDYRKRNDKLPAGVSAEFTREI